MVRLKDVAARAGVSVMTVSKVMRDATDISLSTRARVRALAEQMGYVPDSLARGLRTRATRLLGLVIPAAGNPFFSRLLMAVEEQAQQAGYELMLTQSLNLPEREDAAIRRMLSRRVEGLLIAPAGRLALAATIYDELRHRQIPTVILGPTAPFCRPFVTVGAEDLPGSLVATRHLLSLGHRRIAFLAGPPAAPWARERFEGYRSALREAEVEADDRLIFSAGSSFEDGGKAALQMLQEAVDAAAVQAVNDLVAMGAASALLDHQVRVPEQMSVVGFGDLLTSACFRVPLTTVHQPKYRLGVAAMNALIQLIHGQRAEVPRLPMELILHSSTAAPPGIVPTAPVPVSAEPPKLSL